MKENIKLPVFLILLLIFGSSCYLDSVPTASGIKGWKEMRPFILDDVQVTGIYRYKEFNDFLFKYTTKIQDEEVFWEKLDKILTKHEWKEKSRTEKVRKYERIFHDGDKSEYHPFNGVGGCAEFAHVGYITKRNSVVVGYIRTNPGIRVDSFDETTIGKWAKGKFWPRFYKTIENIEQGE